MTDSSFETTVRERAISWLDDGCFSHLAFVEFGKPDAPPVVCVHGLTRNSRDFDPLAHALSTRFRVVAPDLPGRGRSDWLGDSARYTPAVYVSALSHLLTFLGCPVRWIGTSLGGICGMLIASMPGNPIERLVLNDIGPLIPKSGVARIRDYLATRPDAFTSVADIEAYLRQVHAPFGKLTDAQWRHLATHSSRTLPDGRVALHFDPALAEPIVRSEPQTVDLWAAWQRITVPRLVIRGAESDLLEPATVAQMRQDGAEVLEIAQTGHAPALMDAPTIAAISAFLDA